MATYKVRDPQGNIREISGPDGATDDEVIAQAQKLFSTPSTQQRSVMAPAPTAEQQSMASMPSRIAQGLRDPVDASAQLLTRALPEGVVQAGNQLNNWLADKTGLVGRLPEGGVDQQVREREQQYQQARQATGQEGIDWARLGGNVLSPMNVAIASKIPAGATTLGRMASGVAGGGAFGAFASPVTEGKPEEFWGEKAKNTLLAAGLGGAFPAAAAMLSPNVRPDVAKLLREGVTPTPGQIVGGRLQTIEDKLTSVPILGDAISSARGKSLDEFNQAALARALKPIGEKVDDIGQSGIAGVREKLGAAYEKLLPNLSFKADPQFTSELAQVRQMASTLPPQQAQQFEKVLREQVVGKMTSQGNMSGSTLKQVESELGRLAKGYAGDASFDNRQLADALRETQRVMRETLVRSNPQAAEKLQAINTGYANYARLRDAMSRQGAQERFTPAQLAAAVRGADKTVGKRAYSEGTALMQDLSDAGRNVLMQKYPDSGSIGRLLMGAGVAGGGAMVSPTAMIAGGAATLPYLPGGRQLAAALLARRPQGAAEAAEAVRKIGPYMTPALIQALNTSGNVGP